ncbi:MAG: VCBS repeat-containing protein [Verrucomicrobiales bacterium]|nr:VCBS repeat-containing protein [Verrucomicrobiales bacterium]
MQRTYATAAWGDFDGDGRPDLYLCGLEPGPGQLFRNTTNGMVRVDTGNIAEDSVARGGAVWGDIDNDGDLDLLVGSIFSTSDLLYRNNGNGILTSFTALPATDGFMRQSLTSSDINSDGYLDFFVANGSGGGSQPNFLLMNNQGLSFSLDTKSEAAVESRPSNGSSLADYDNDLDLDLLITDALNPNSLFRNDLGVFVRTTSGALGESTSPQGGNGAAWGDYDNDGDLDLILPTGQRFNLLFRNDGGTISRVANPPITDAAAGSFASVWADFDNDGWLDLLISQRDQSQLLYRGLGNGGFEKIDIPVLSSVQSANGLAVADFDLDGDLDVWMGSWIGGPPSVLLENHASGNHWLRVKLQGDRSNRAGIGAKIIVSARIGGRAVSQLRQVGGFDSVGSHELIAHFGLGDALSVESVTVEWPSGAVQNLGAQEADQVLRLQEPPPPPLSFNPGSSHFTNSTTLIISTPIVGAEIRYTLDGSDPQPASILFVDQIILTRTTTVRARLFANGFPASETVSAHYSADPGLYVEPIGGRFTNSTSIFLDSRIPGTQIRYTEDGSTPTLDSKVYVGPIRITTSAVISARGYLNGFPVTEVVKASYLRVYAFAADGISDDWRRQYFGDDFQTDPRAAADADPDFDRSSNLQEFAAKTHPLDPLSGFSLTVRALPEVGFPSVPGQRYRILRRTTITGSFEAITEITAEGSLTRYVDLEAGTMVNPAFYIVEPARP